MTAKPLPAKQAKQLTLDLWLWLAETGENKCEWPKYDETGLDDMEGLCPLCQYFETICFDGCPLRDGVTVCGDDESLFMQWDKAEYESDERKALAKQIADKVAAWNTEGLE